MILKEETEILKTKSLYLHICIYENTHTHTHMKFFLAVCNSMVQWHIFH